MSEEKNRGASTSPWEKYYRAAHQRPSMFIFINHRGAPDSWRNPQARDRCRPDDGCTNTWPRRRRPPSQGLEDLSLQSCRRYRINGHVCRPDDLFSTTIWTGARTWFIYSFDKKYPQPTRLHFIHRYHLRTVSVFGTADSTEFE